MNIIFDNGPLRLTVEGGIEVHRSVACEVPDELGERLIESGIFKPYIESREEPQLEE